MNTMEEASLKKSTGSKGSSLHPQGSACSSRGGRESQAATMVKLPNGQLMQVQRVIQTAQSTVIQSPQVQRPQVEDAERGTDVPASNKRRENISRRAPYRKINNFVSEIPTVQKIEDKAEDGDNSNVPAIPMQTSIFQTSSGQYIAFTQGGAIQLTNAAGEGLQGLQTLTVPTSGAPQSGPPMVPYGSQSGDGTQQYYMPGNKMMVQATSYGAPHIESRVREHRLELYARHMAVTGDETESAATGDISAYQIHNPAPSLPQGVMMSGSPNSMHCPQQHTEEATRKREVRLLKNRDAAKECRRRKREYVRCLENRLSVLEVQNKKLLEELQYLKDIYSVKSS